MKNRLLLGVATLLATLSASAVDDNTVVITYNGTSASVEIAGNISSYVSCSTGTSSHVKIAQTSTTAANPGEIVYQLTGSSTDGEFYMEGEYKASLILDDLTLTNPSGPAINIQDGKRINVSLKSGTASTLTDAAGGDWKGCFACKGHTEFKGKGSLTVNGKTAHGIWSKEYVEVKNCTISIPSPAKDGINCNQYFLMESGSLTITSAGDDGIQVSLKDETSTGTTTDHEDEDSGNFYMTGGTLSISGSLGYAIKTQGTVSNTGGTRDISGDTLENATTGIQTVTAGDAEETIYDLSGRQLPKGHRQKGIFIIKGKDKTRKVIR